MAIPAITNNSPSAGSIAWGAFSIQYAGVSYGIPAGSTSQRWVWWRYNTGGSTSIIEAGPDIPANLKDDDLVLFGNKNGIGLRVQSTSYVDGELLVDGSIFADAIAANQITSAKISTAGLDAGVIKFGEMSGSRIAADTITATQLAANSVTTSELAVGAVTAEKIKVGAITAVELAAGAVTAEELAAGAVTADKIAANSIAASKLILSDMTNLAVDGELIDPTAANWSYVKEGVITRVDNVNEHAYLETTNTIIPSVVWFQNENVFGINPYDEFQLYFEVSTPSTNTETITFNPAIEVHDRDGNPQLWRNVDTPPVVLPPGTDWISAQGKIVIDDPNITRGRFNSYAMGLTSAAGTQKVRIRRVLLRRRNGGELIVDGSLTAKHINVQSLAADIMNTGLLQAGLTLTGALNIADSDMGWSKASGLWFGNGTAFYGDSRTNQIEGDLVTSSISIKTGLSLGGDADIHGVMELSNGVSTPTAKMALGETWPRALSAAVTSSDAKPGTVDKLGQWHGIYQLDANRWIAPVNFFGTGMTTIQKSNLTSGGDILLDDKWSNQFFPMGFTTLGNSHYILGADGKRNNDYYIYKLSTTGTFAKQAEVKIGNNAHFNNVRARLFSDGNNIGMVWSSAAGNTVMRFYNAGLTARVGATDFTLLTNVGVRNIGGCYFGPTYSGGPNRLVISLFDGDSNMIRVWTIGGTAAAPTVTRTAAEDFPRAMNSTVLGLVYDSAQGRMLHMDRYGYFYTYSKYVNGGTLNAQYTFYDGDNSVYPSGTIINSVDVSGQVSGPHETPPSPVTTFQLSKRAWPTVTAPPAQDELVTDVTKVDKANRLGVYASINGSPRLQTYLPVGVRSIPVTDELSTGTALAGSSGVPSFANAMVPSPGLLRSSKRDSSTLPVIELDGDGSGRLGTRSWNGDGLWTPLCRAALSGSSPQSQGSNSETAIALPTTIYNVGCNVSGNSITVGKSGWYRVDLLASWTAVNGGSRIAVLRRNAATVSSWVVPHSNTSAHVNASFSHYMNLNAGDSVSMAQYHSATGNVNTHNQSYPRLYVQQLEDL